jgi:hypothetical protein
VGLTGEDASDKACGKGIPGPDSINDIYRHGCKPAPSLIRCDKASPCPAGDKDCTDFVVVAYFVDVGMWAVIEWCQDVLWRGDTEEATDDW